jgi:hypothetical protein
LLHAETGLPSEMTAGLFSIHHFGAIPTGPAYGRPDERLRIEAESRDSPMRNCGSEFWCQRTIPE